jgi:putative thioredoxin
MALIGIGGKDGGAPAADAGAYIKDSSLATFAADVLQASKEVPVIVDFWAPWCEPCKQLGPMLEKAVVKAKGKVRLVRVNVDENQELAAQLRIQSIPTVYAFKDGQPADAFMGAIPESQIATFIAGLIGPNGGTKGEEVLAAADAAFAAGDVGTAAQYYAHLLKEEPGSPKAAAGLAKCYLKSGDVERAKKTLQLVRPDGATDEAVRAVEAELSLREQAAGVGDLAALAAKVAADPSDHQARFDLALALDGAGRRGEAIEALLEIVRRDRKWNDEAARKHLVTLFEALGPADPLTVAGRRELSSVLFS